MTSPFPTITNLILKTVRFPRIMHGEHRPGWQSVLLLILACNMMSMSLSCANGQVAQQDSQIPVLEDPQIKKYQDYFKSLNLPYMEPLGCGRTMPCQVSADFNDDGTMDLAGLYEYSGPTNRSGNKYLDLVIMYSTTESPNPLHQIFRHVGQVDPKNRVLAKLEEQPVGKLKLPRSTFMLKRPGINVLRKDQTMDSYFPTIYWNGKTFKAIVKSAD